MKTYHHITGIVLLIGLFLLIVFPAKADVKPITDSILPVDLTLVYNKLSDNTIELKATLSTKINDVTMPLDDKELSFSIAGDSEKKIGLIRTNPDGIAILQISPNYILPTKADGIIKYMVSYDGDELHSNSQAEISIKDIQIELNLIKTDSSKSVEVIITKDSIGQRVPVKQIEVFLGVKRMLSLLRIGENTATDDSGKVVIDFPGDLPGDSIGNLIIFAKIQDDEHFGNVEKGIIIKWGIPVSYNHIELPPGLYSDEAPLWMIVAVIVLLGGAWIHFMIVIYLIIKIKRAGKKITIKTLEPEKKIE
jgi:hypothetical protein